MIRFEVLQNAVNVNNNHLMLSFESAEIKVFDNNARDKLEIVFRPSIEAMKIRARSIWVISDVPWSGVFSAWKVQKRKGEVRVFLERGNSMLKNEVLGAWSGNLSAEQTIRSMLWVNWNLSYIYDNLPPTQAQLEFKDFEPLLDRLDKVAEAYGIHYRVVNRYDRRGILTDIIFSRDRPQKPFAELRYSDIADWSYIEDISEVYNRAVVSTNSKANAKIVTINQPEPSAIGAGVTKYVKESVDSDYVAGLIQERKMRALYAQTEKVEVISNSRGIEISQPVYYTIDDLGITRQGVVVEQSIKITNLSYEVTSKIV